MVEKSKVASEWVPQSLQASETRYRRLFESAKDGILILDADTGQIIDVNPFLTQLLGYEHADFVGKMIWDFGAFHDVVASKEAFAELEATDYVAYDDLPLKTRAGTLIDVGFVSNVYLVDGKRNIQCNIRDLTKAKQQERVRLGLEEQLRASQKMEAIGGLAGGIAHDFNNLLSVILCYTGFALETLTDGDPLKDDLIDIKKAALRGASLTRQLLAFSRKQVLQPTSLDLNQVAESLEKMLRRILGEDIELVLRLDRDLGKTMADASQIEQVIMNLMVNARDAMPKGGTITLETKNVTLDAEYVKHHLGALPGLYVLLTVTDSGEGMNPATLARVFEPFFTTKGPGKGTGLGLSTAYGIVKQSGGDISVYSELDRGTKFEVYLPRDLALVERVLPLPAAAILNVQTKPATVLLVEDDEAVRELTTRILARDGHQVLAAVNGVDALALCELHRGKVDLVVTDVVMPQLGGRAFASQLHQTQPGAKILFMSGYSDDAIARHGVLEPGSRFIGKPFTALELIKQVQELLNEVP